MEIPAQTEAGNVSENNEPNAMPKQGDRQKGPKEVIFVGDSLPNAQPNLQASFMKFREQKIKEMQMMKMAKQASLTNNRTPEFKDALRKKFVETAKKYLGVPYAFRYKAPEDPIAPLYLDCCALIRQALLDLQDEFGFAIGRWNQCYQIDTLPIVLKQEEMKPGDLIFYEGEYYSNRSKPQKHNMVHVEIFLGGESGEECIGSRYHRGKVSIFPSFKFTSTTWKLVNFHFRSLDTWLDGVCKSCCPDHPWQSDSLNYLEAAGKRSIFSDASPEDVNAGGDEDDDLQGQQDVCIPCGDTVDDYLEASTPMTVPADEENEDAVTNAKSDESKDASVVVSDALLPPVESNTSSKKPAVTAGSNKVKRPSPYRSGSNNDIDGKNDTKDSGNSNTTLKAGIAVGNFSSNKVSGSGRSAKNEPHHAYFVGKSNGWKLVKDSMDRRGWTQLPFDYQFSTRYGLKWVERRSQIDYRAHQPGQLVCHIPNNDVLCTKIGLLSVMRDFFQGSASSSTETLNPIPWIPETYDLELPSDVHHLLLKEEQHQQSLASVDDAQLREEQQNIWIYKPAACNRGRGIRVVSGLESLRAICIGEEFASTSSSLTSLPNGKRADGPTSGMTNASNKAKGVIQRYILNPLLVHGCKFDIRCYLLIARNFPTTYAFYHPGYCRLALKLYPTTKSDLIASLDDTMMHLTNASIQKKGCDYASMGSLQIQSIQNIITHMEETQRPDNARYIAEQLDQDIMRCMVDLVRSSNNKFLRRHGYFDLLGCDFMITSDNQLHLLEVNTNPAMSLDNDVLEDLLPRVIDGALELVLQTQGPDAIADAGGDIQSANIDIQNVLSQKLPSTKSDFKLIFDESKNWYFSS